MIQDYMYYERNKKRMVSVRDCFNDLEIFFNL